MSTGMAGNEKAPPTLVMTAVVGEAVAVVAFTALRLRRRWWPPRKPPGRGGGFGGGDSGGGAVCGLKLFPDGARLRDWLVTANCPGRVQARSAGESRTRSTMWMVAACVKAENHARIRRCRRRAVGTTRDLACMRWAMGNSE